MAKSKGRSSNRSSMKSDGKAKSTVKATARTKSTTKAQPAAKALKTAWPGKVAVKAAGKPTAAKASSRSKPTGDLRPVIEKRAYEIWLAKGRPVGLDQQNWREAEHEVLNKHGVGV